MENTTKTKNETKDYVMKTSNHLFTYADEERGDQTFIKVIPFIKDNKEMYAIIKINSNGTVNVKIDDMTDGGKFWTRYGIFKPWEKHKSIRYFKEMRLKMDKVKKVLDGGWTDKSILEATIKEIFKD